MKDSFGNDQGFVPIKDSQGGVIGEVVRQDYDSDTSEVVVEMLVDGRTMATRFEVL